MWIIFHSSVYILPTICIKLYMFYKLSLQTETKSYKTSDTKPFTSCHRAWILVSGYPYRQDMNAEKHQQTETTPSEPGIFLYTTITGGLQLIHLKQIVYFQYNSQNKIWEAVLQNERTLVLKRNTTSHKILSLHPNFIQICQSYIINISYLEAIEDGCCILTIPSEKKETLQISKAFMKQLKDKYPCIWFGSPTQNNQENYEGSICKSLYL